ncbi:hypothetical protein ACLKA6_001119 [Drosophila palustris]
MVCLNKSDLRVLTGYLTGHCGLRYHLKKLNLSDTETCRFCALELETSEHVLCECPALCRPIVSRSLDDVLKAFDDYSIPFKNIAMESYKFNNIMQSEGQPFMEFET